MRSHLRLSQENSSVPCHFSEDLCLDISSDCSGWTKTSGFTWSVHDSPAKDAAFDCLDWVATTDEPWIQVPRKLQITTATLTAVASGMALGALAYKYFTRQPPPPTLTHAHVTVGEFMQAELTEQQNFLIKIFPPFPLRDLPELDSTDTTCRLCLIEPACILTRPCNHVVMCQDCDIVFLVNVLKTIFTRRSIPPVTTINGRFISNLLPTREYVCIVCREPISKRFKVVEAQEG